MQRRQQNKNTSTKVKASRYHCFRLVLKANDPRWSDVLAGLDSHRSLTAWAHILHDRDEGVEPHHHLAIRCATARTVADVAHYLGVPESSVRLLGGRGAFPRYVRYMTHEGLDVLGAPESFVDELHHDGARPKFVYPRECMVSNFDWQGLVDALAVRRRRPTPDQLATALMSGSMSRAEVLDLYPDIYAKHAARFQRAAREGAEVRREAEAEARHAASQAERAAMEEAARVRVEEAARDAAAEADRVAAAAQAAAIEHEEKVRVTQEWLDAEAAFRRTPEGLALAEAEEQARRAREDFVSIDRLVDAFCIDPSGSQSITGTRPARDRGVEKLMGVPQFEWTTDLVRAWFAEESCLRDDEVKDYVVELEHWYKVELPNDLIFGESRASEGSEASFERALSARLDMAKWPDLFDVPKPRDDIRRAWRDQLYAASWPGRKSQQNDAQTIALWEGRLGSGVATLDDLNDADPELLQAHRARFEKAAKSVPEAEPMHSALNIEPLPEDA